MTSTSAVVMSERPAAGPGPAPNPGSRADLGAALRPLLLDAALPVGAYFIARDALGASLVAAITVSSAITLARTAWTFARERRANQLALLILASNVAGLVFGLTTGDARFLIAKDSGVSSVIALAILWSVARGRPMMSEGLVPFLTQGRPEREAALGRLRTGARFTTLERRFSLVWGGVLLVECVLRIIGAYTIAPSTMAWGSTVLLVGAIVVATVVGGAAAARPMTELVDAAVADHPAA